MSHVRLLPHVSASSAPHGPRVLPGLLASLVPPPRRTPRDGVEAERALVRDRILRALEADPGVTPSRLVLRLAMGWSTLYFHLDALEAAGLLRRVRHGRHCFLFPEGIAGDLERSLQRTALEGERARLLAEEIVRAPGHDIASLAAAVGVSPRVVYHHVRRMRLEGLVASSREHRYCDLAPTPRLRELLRDGEAGA